MLKRLIVFLCVVVLLPVAMIPSGEVEAQGAFAAFLVYPDAAGNLVYYDSMTETETVLVEADPVRVYRYTMSRARYGAYAVAASYSYEVDENGESVFGSDEYMLYIVSLINGELVHSQSRLPQGFNSGAPGEMLLGEPAVELPASLRNKPVWSPDGRRVAWVQGLPDGSATLAVWNSFDGSVIELPGSGNYPYSPVWSPDSMQLVYNDLVTVGTGAGYSVTGAYVVAADASTSRQLDMEADGRFREFFVLGWQNDTTFIFTWFDIWAGTAGIYGYDLATDTQTVFLGLEDAFYSEVVYDSATDIAVFNIANAVTLEQEGLHALNLDTGDIQQLAEIQDSPLMPLRVLPGGGFVVTNQQLIVSPKNGGFTILPPDYQIGRQYENGLAFAFSPSGDNVLLNTDRGTVLYNIITGDEILLSSGRYLKGIWETDDVFLVQIIEDGVVTIYQGDFYDGGVEYGWYTIKSGTGNTFTGVMPG